MGVAPIPIDILEALAALELRLGVGLLDRGRGEIGGRGRGASRDGQSEADGDEAAGQSGQHREWLQRGIVRNARILTIHCRWGQKIGNNVSFIRPSLSVLFP